MQDSSAVAVVFEKQRSATHCFARFWPLLEKAFHALRKRTPVPAAPTILHLLVFETIPLFKHKLICDRPYKRDKPSRKANLEDLEKSNAEM